MELDIMADMDRGRPPLRACPFALAGTFVLVACGDAEPFRFENIRVEEVSAYRAVVRFETSREASCHILYGTAPDSLDTEATDPDMEPGTLVIEHQVPLEDLTPATSYFFKALAVDGDGDEHLSEMGEMLTSDGASVDTMINVALAGSGAAVTAVSSNFGGGDNESVWGANNAIDGLMATEWSSNGDGDDAFLEIDLGQERDVEVIAFRSRSMLDGTSIVRRFELVIDGELTLGPFDTPDPDIRYLVTLDQPVTMQAVRMNAVETTGGNTGLKELQLLMP